MYAGGGLTTLSNFVSVQCGNASTCSGDNRTVSYGFGATYWVTRYLGVEGSYLHPTKLKISGGDGYAFNTDFTADVWSILGKAGVQAGAMRIYGHGGVDYHEATSTTTETIDVATQKFETQTSGWSYIFGGGAEVWFKKKAAIFGELDIAKLKGDAKGGGEAKIDDQAATVLVGIRLHVGG